MYAAHMYFPVKTELTFSVIPENTLIFRVLEDKHKIVVQQCCSNVMLSYMNQGCIQWPEKASRTSGNNLCSLLPPRG